MFRCIWISLIALGFFCSPANAQVLTPKKASSGKTKTALANEQQPKAKLKDLSADEQWKLGNELASQADQADTAQKLAVVIDKCREILKGKLTDEYQAYFKSLLAWSLSKRAEKRFDNYQQMLLIGNPDQAKLIINSARHDADESIKLDATKWRSFLNRGIICNAQLDYQQAANDFQKVCQLADKKSYGWFNLAEIQYELGQFKDALKNYQQASTIATSDVQSMTGVAHCLVHLKQPEKAIKKYTVVIRLRPDSSAALINRGDVHLSRSRWKSALDDYSSAANIDANPMAYQRAAWLMATCPEPEFFKPETALLLAAKAVDDKSFDQATALDTLAAAQAACGDFETAINTQRKALAAAENADETMERRLAMYQQEKPFRQQQK